MLNSIINIIKCSTIENFFIVSRCNGLNIIWVALYRLLSPQQSTVADFPTYCAKLCDQRVHFSGRKISALDVCVYVIIFTYFLTNLYNFGCQIVSKFSCKMELKTGSYVTTSAPSFMLTLELYAQSGVRGLQFRYFHVALKVFKSNLSTRAHVHTHSHKTRESERTHAPAHMNGVRKLTPMVSQAAVR